MEKIRNWLCPAVFILFLFVTAALFAILPDRAYGEREKRYLTTAPQITWEAVLDGSVQEELEDWMADQFPGRDFVVGIHSYWNLLTGRNVQQDFYYGKDGYLIGAPAASDTAQFASNLSRFEQFAANCGIPASMVLVPSTGWLKDDVLPFGHSAYTDDALFQIAAETLQTAAFYDFRHMLLQADQEADVCYHTDHHLTAFGSYTLYSAWCDARGIIPLDRSAYEIESVRGFYGTAWSGSGYWMTQPDTVELWDSGAEVTVTITDGGQAPVVSSQMFFREHLDQLDMYPVYLDGNHCQVEIHNPAAPEGTILLIKDSYAHCFAPFLTEHYENVILLDLRFYRGSITEFIQEYEVDEVLFFYGASTLLTDTNSAWLF